MVRMSARFISQRITNQIDAGIKALEVEPEREYKAAASEVATWWSKKIQSSGRGGSWNRQMSMIESSTTKSRAGNWTIRLGWLGNAPMAKDGKTTWFVYQDRGYHLFGGSRFISGLLLQIDARERLDKEVREANERIAINVKRAIRRGK